MSKAIVDNLTQPTLKALKKKYKLDLDISRPWHGSLQVACELFDQARMQKKSILFFIHGYNNDVEDVINTADEIEKLYEVIVVPFTWPANGGGAISVHLGLQGSAFSKIYPDPFSPSRVLYL